MMLTHILQHTNGGSLEEIDLKISELVAAVKATGKPGSIRIELKIAPSSKHNSEAMVVEDDITTKLPSPNRKPAIFFPTEDNRLQRNNPNQTEMDLRVIHVEPSQPLKKVVNQ